MTNEHLDCEETVRRASLYLDGRLSADSRQSIQEHLRSCDACVREYRRFGRLSRATHNLPQRRVVADLAQCVRERVADRREGVLASLGHGRVRFVAAGAAALVLITAGAWWIGFRMGRDVAGDAATPGVAEVASKEDSPKTDAAPSNPPEHDRGEWTQEQKASEPPRAPPLSPPATPQEPSPAWLQRLSHQLLVLRLTCLSSVHARRPGIHSQ